MGAPRMGSGMNVHAEYGTTRALECVLSTLMFLSGVVLLYPGDTFGLPHYSTMRQWVSEDFGAGLLVAVAIVRAVALYVNGGQRRTPLARLIGCIVGAGFWLTLAVSLETAVMETGAAVPLLLAVAVTAFGAEFYSAMRCGADASHLDTFGVRVPLHGGRDRASRDS